MANLIVTFTHDGASPPRAHTQPLAAGGSARTEQIAIGATSAAGSELGTSADYIVDLKAKAECWVAVGSAPTAVAGSGWHMDTDERLQFYIGVGEKVAVVQAGA
jgi:hypothetical protein